jgi:RNA polymerase sigma factor (sigma-70 family)
MLTSEPVLLAPDDEPATANCAPDGDAPDRERLCELLIDREHRQQLEQIARKNTRGSGVDWEDARNAAQYKILKAVQSGKFRYGDADAFYRWASSVARFEIIDLVRKDKREHCTSLDQPIGSEGETSWLELVADDFNALDSLVRSDLVERAIAAIVALDQAHPEKCFLQLWQAKLTNKRQADLAAELEITQSAVSKRWKELTQQLIIHLGWQETQPKPMPNRQRSPKQW